MFDSDDFLNSLSLDYDSIVAGMESEMAEINSVRRKYTKNGKRHFCIDDIMASTCKRARIDVEHTNSLYERGHYNYKSTKWIQKVPATTELGEGGVAGGSTWKIQDSEPVRKKVFQKSDIADQNVYFTVNLIEQVRVYMYKASSEASLLNCGSLWHKMDYGPRDYVDDGVSEATKYDNDDRYLNTNGSFTQSSSSRQAICSRDPNGTATMYTVAPRRMYMNANTGMSDEHSGTGESESGGGGGGGGDGLGSRHLKFFKADPNQTYQININMSKGFEEFGLFTRALCAKDGQAIGQVGKSIMTTCSSTIYDPFMGITNEMTYTDGCAIPLLEKETFHADKLVVSVPRENDGNRRNVSFRRKNGNKKKGDGIGKGRGRSKRRCRGTSGFGGTVKKESGFAEGDEDGHGHGGVEDVGCDDGMDLVELQFFPRCCRVSGRSSSQFMMVMEQLVNMFKCPNSSANLNMFLANVKAYMSHTLGTLISAVMNDLIEFIAWEMQTHEMDEHMQMYLFQTVGKAVVDHMESNRNNFAEYNITSTCRRSGGMNSDVGDYNSMSFKYKNPRTNVEFLRSSLFDADGSLKRKSKLRCDDLCKKRLTRAGIVRRWEEFTQRYKNNFDLIVPTEQLK